MRSLLKAALFLSIATLIGLFPTSGWAQTPSSASLSPTPPAFAEGGAQTCLKCHGTESKVSPILQSAHAAKGDPHSPFGQDGCESCHGPSAAHVASRSNPPAVVFKGPKISSAAERSQQCLSCHESGLRINWQGSQHQRDDVACDNCHSMHAPKDSVLAKETQPEKCFGCHAEQRADAAKFSHHPIREGKVVCADCHNPHGSAGPKLLKEFTVNETCYNCHAEKRGPLLWEHAPVRENCLTCHTPHGSTQARLLVQRAPYICQECHANSGHQAQPMAGQNLAGQVAANFRLQARGCVNCHSQIHGSNSPNGTFLTR